MVKYSLLNSRKLLYVIAHVITDVNMAPLTAEDRLLIKTLRIEKGWTVNRMITEFPAREWKRRTLYDLVRKIDSTGSAERLPGSGRPRSARTVSNIQLVDDLICSQEGKPGTSRTPREIARETGISHSSVVRIAKNDLQLKVYRRCEVQTLSTADKLKRLNACKRLKKRMTQSKISRTWFSDEKTFTVETPSNSQNDRVYAMVNAKRDVSPSRLLKCRKHFTKSIMVSVAVSKLGKTSLVFVQPGAKVNSAYYCDHVLKNGLLQDIHQLSGNNFTFQQDGAPSHRSKHTVEFLQTNVPDFIEPSNWPPNSPDLNPVDYSIWGALQQLVYRQKITDIEHLKRVLINCWDTISQELINGAIDQWSKRLSLVIRSHGGHIEHHFR